MTGIFAISAPVAALIGAAVAAAINLLVLAAVGLREERRRRRDFYAAALEATLAYREFAYAIPRRRHDALAEERVRISEALREVQRDLARAESLMRVERATKVRPPTASSSPRRAKWRAATCATRGNATRSRRIGR